MSEEQPGAYVQSAAATDQQQAPPQEQSMVIPYGAPMPGAVPGAVPAGAPPPGVLPQAAPPTQWQGPYLDATSGRYYYYNPWTQQSSWAQAMASPGDPAALASGMPQQPAAMPAMPSAIPGMPAGYPMMPMPYGYPYMAPGAMTAAYGGAPAGGALPASSAGTTGGRDECGDYKRGKCDRGDTCRFAHVKPTQECRDYRAGRCTRGSNCKFLHDNEVAHKVAPAPARERSRSR
mmetsp:Transcript_17790/g.45037  ORF Transcript_17790/g.45037 Transcript_17790/m.45037 type:complete len:233 (+) Transcript_17790:49-747(+)